MDNSEIKKQKAKLYKEWRDKLSQSKLPHHQQIKRAKEFARKGMKVVNDN